MQTSLFVKETQDIKTSWEINIGIDTTLVALGIKYSDAYWEHIAFFSILSMKYCRHSTTFIKKNQKSHSIAAIHRSGEGSGDCRGKDCFQEIYAMRVSEL